MESNQKDWQQAFFKHDYLACARMGLNSLGDRFGFEELILILISLQRTGYEDRFNGLAPQFLEAFADFPWVVMLMNLAVGQAELADAIEAAETDEQLAQAYCYYGVRSFTVHKIAFARDSFNRCLNVNTRGWEKMLAEAELSFAVPDENEVQIYGNPGVDESVNTNLFANTRQDIVCDSCGKVYWPDIWLVIDIEQRPDLARRIQDGTITHLICPHCGHSTKKDQLDLLIYRQSNRPHFIYSESPIADTSVSGGVGTDSMEVPEGVSFLVNLMQRKNGLDGSKMAELMGSIYPSASFPGVAREDLALFLKGLAASDWSIHLREDLKSPGNSGGELENMFSLSKDSACVSCGIHENAGAIVLKINNDWLNDGNVSLYFLCDECASGYDREWLLEKVMSRILFSSNT